MIRWPPRGFVSERIAALFGRDTGRFLLGVLVPAVLLVVASGCRPVDRDPLRSGQAVEEGHALIRPALPRLRRELGDSFERHLGPRDAKTRRAVSASPAPSVAFEHPAATRARGNPWEGFMAMEESGGEAVAGARRRPIDFRALRAVLTRRGARAGPGTAPWTYPRATGLDEHLEFIEGVLLKAEDLKEEALARLSASERTSVFEHGVDLVRLFTPQYGEASVEEAAHIEAGYRFLETIHAKVDYDRLLDAAEVLLHLTHEPWLRAVAESASRHAGPPASIDGFAGRILAVRDTRAGSIVIGGPGANTYELGRGVALVLDTGGADLYRGQIAVAASVREGNRMVIDVGGNDRYEAAALGLATGRLAVGAVVDTGGDDLYRLAEGAGGTAFGGIGILYDLDGHDRYIGTRLTLGAAVAGLGLVVDRAGRDRFTIDGYGLGFGGPLGVGAVLEAGGDDHYACGGRYPSTYNAVDAPGAAPGDEAYQYEGFCLGVGVGVRVLSQDAALTASQRAGGIGFLVDRDGNDTYAGANFSQGTGYFFGAGLLLDLDGDDHHGGARYGHGAAAHRGVGLFIDAGGRDRYGSSGPRFNGGTAWDHSVAMFLDAGSDDDRYDFSRSDGLGRAAHTSWSLFMEEGGRDRYAVKRGFGLADHSSVSGFFDLEGRDHHVPGGMSEGSAPGNGQTVRRGGGLYVDR